MQPMWLCLFSRRRFEEPYDNSQWRKVTQMQPVWFYIISGMRFEETFENPQWRKVAYMQPVWLCILPGRQFEETFVNTQWRKIKQMKPLSHCTHLWDIWKHTTNATNNVNPMRGYLKTHTGKNLISETNVTCLLLYRQLEGTYQNTRWRQVK